MTGAADITTITTPRLTLRPLARADLPALVEGAGDLAVSRWMSVVPHPYTMADGEEFLAQVEAGEAGHAWAIEDGDGFRGVISHGAELGFWIVRSAWGRGYMSEAAAAVVHALIEGAGVGEIRSSFFTGNHGSRRVHEKLGFRVIGRDAQEIRATGKVGTLERALLRAADFTGHPIRIDTPNLRLDPLRPEDSADLCRIVTIPEVGRMLFLFPPDWTEDAARDFIGRWQWRGALAFRLAVRDRDGRFIGSVGALAHDGKVELFYFLDPAVAGQGYATEAMRGFIAFLFARFAPPALHADVFTDNPASSKVLAKLGFRKTGEGMGRSAARLEPAPLYLYRLTQSEFGATT